MTILLTGGTGFIGSTILSGLLQHGHEVRAIVRSAAAAATVEGAGATAVQGDITNVAWLSEQLRDVDGAIHTASPGDASSPTVDEAVARSVVAAFGGTSKPYIQTGGIWVHGPGDDITEETPIDSPDLVAWRAGVEAIVLNSDVVASVVEPAVVYGRGSGIPALLRAAPRAASGELTTIGDGTGHWATVHVDDLAALYIRVLELGNPLGRVIGASGVNPMVADLSAAFAGGPVVPEGVDASRSRLGVQFADALLASQQAGGAKARSLGWVPTGPTLIDDITSGSYAR
jgi:nucleoside-diphosphate-sugar epimerase